MNTIKDQSISVATLTAPPQMILSVANDFSPFPGARYRDDGPFSGEAFREEILKPQFVEALRQDTVLLVNLDGVEGYATSFLEEAFGGLAREYGNETVLKHLDFQSWDEPLLIDEIRNYIQEARQR